VIDGEACIGPRMTDPRLGEVVADEFHTYIVNNAGMIPN
jgi:hypothetical protein